MCMKLKMEKQQSSREGEKPFVVPESELSEVTDEDLLQEEEVEMNDPQLSNPALLIEPFEGSPYGYPGENVEFTV